MVRKPSAGRWIEKYLGTENRSRRAASYPKSAGLLMAFSTSLFLGTIADAESIQGQKTPVKNDLPLNAESFCKGTENVLRRQKQGAEKEIAQLCNGSVPTDLLRELIRNPYSGNNNYKFHTINLGPISNTSYVAVNVAYSMRIKKSAVALLLAEEGMIKDQTYANGDGSGELNVAVKLLPVDLSKTLLATNEADTAFALTQRSMRTSGQRQFDNISAHDLRLYRMNPNNYDFMMSIRSLNNPAVDGKDPIFRHGIVIRAAMTDPNDTSSGISITLLNFEVSDQRNQDATVQDVFSAYVNRDIRAIYRYHTKK